MIETTMKVSIKHVFVHKKNELDICGNGNKGVSNDIMGNHVFPSMGTS
jgi:hypothetical protein